MEPTLRRQPDQYSPFEKAERAVRNFVQAVGLQDVSVHLQPTAAPFPTASSDDIASASQLLKEVFARQAPQFNGQKRPRPKPARPPLVRRMKNQMSWY